MKDHLPNQIQLGEVPTKTEPSTCYVDDDSFVEHFKIIWTREFGNALTKDMPTVWRKMSLAFNHALKKSDPHILQVIRGEPDHSEAELQAYRKTWTGIPAQCGSGKSTGSYLWLALFANQLEATAGEFDAYEPGAIYMTRTIEQADEAVDQINWIFRSFDHDHEHDCAVACHTGNKLDPEATKDFPVLVLCSEGFVNIIERVDRGQTHYQNRWDHFRKWSAGDRALVIIDESLQNTVDHYQLTAKDLQRALEDLPSGVAKAFPVEIKIAKRAAKVLANLSKKAKERREIGQRTGSEDLAYEDRLRVNLKLNELFKSEADRDLKFDELLKAANLYWREYPSKSERTNQDRKSCRNAFKNLDGMLRLIIYHAQEQHKGSSLNSGRLLIPEDHMPCGIVLLDATLESSTLVNVLGPEKLRHVPVPSIRNFQNFKWFVARTGGGTGHGAMTDEREMPKRIDKLFDFMDKSFDKPVPGRTTPRRVLIVGHKKLTEAIKEKYVQEALGRREKVFPACDRASRVEYLVEGQTIKPIVRPYELDVAHWNGLTGKNKWREFDTVVVYSMFYQPPVNHYNMVLAFRGREFFWTKQARQLRYELTNKFIAGETTQAMLRISPRMVSDDQGNCLPSECYQLVGNDAVSEQVIDQVGYHLGKDPDGDWDFEFVPSLSAKDKAFLTVTLRDPGEHNIQDLLDKARIHDKADRASLVERASRSDTRLAKQLKRNGCEVVGRRGRYGGTFIIVPDKAKNYGFDQAAA